MTLALADLRIWSASGPPLLDGLRPGLAVIGDPVTHSLSPQMHQPALDAAGRGLAYVKLHLLPGELAEGFARMAATGFVGCNVTVPHKLEALEACVAATPHARRLGAVNTITFGPDGPRGANTDGPGLLAALEESLRLDLPALRRQRILILGAGGGAGQASAIQLALSGCPRLILANRSESKLPPLADRIRSALADDGLPAPAELRLLGSDDPDTLGAAVAGADLILHASNLGRDDADPLPVPAAALRPGQAVMDLVYRPGGTRLVHAALAAGARAVDGLPLLLHQGALSQQIWFGQTPDLAALRRGLAQAH